MSSRDRSIVFLQSPDGPVPSGGTGGDRPALRDLSAEAQDAVRLASREFSVRLEPIHDAIVREALQRVPLAEDGSHLVTSLSDAVIANLTAFVATVVGRLQIREHAPVPEEFRCAANLARAGRPADDLLRIYRTLQSELESQWRRSLRAAAPDLATFADADAVTTRMIFEMADAVVPALMHHHALEMRREPSVLTTRRSGTLRRALFDPDIDVHAASARLGYELDRWHVAVAAWTDPDAADVDRRLDAIVEAVERAGGRRPLATRTGTNVVHIWSGSTTEPTDLEIPVVEGAVLAVGRPGRGLEGFRRSRYEAVRALDLARGMSRPAGTVTSFAELEVLALLYADPEEAARFATEVLGPVYATEAGPSFVETMRVLYEEDLNAGRAAERLGVHRNTVTYRLRKVLELSGELNPTALRLHAAVTLAPLMPWAAPGASPVAPETTTTG
ncbi:MAG: helix-turn-helix domain-containing protein [Solirubrobacteraceae bacterium]|nr:helix-turn-helix domain-containing protein [Solirubrobacteraceae bacterium]